MSTIPLARVPAVSQADCTRKFRKINAPRLCFMGRSVSWRTSKSGLIDYYGVCASRREEGVGDRASFMEEEEEEEVLMEDTLNLGASGVEATLNDLTKWLILVAPPAIVLWRHDGPALWAASGSVLNCMLSVVLKTILNQERPIPGLKPDPGMPSSHAQSFFYITTIVNVLLVEKFGLSTLTTLLCGIIFILSSYISWLRVSQQLHTRGQVTVGAVIGSIFAILWSWSWYSLLSNSFTSLLWVRIAVILITVGSYLSFARYFILNSAAEVKDFSYKVDLRNDS